MASTILHEGSGRILGGKYRLGRLLGRGSMGAVYEARHERTGRALAVKILHFEYVENPEVAARFLREARMVAELKHPNVVDVLDMDEDPDGTVYMVLELLEGESLARLLLREKVLAFDQAAELLVPVMRALTFAHEHGIVHRDLKPENIFLHRDPAGELIPKLLDFGIARALDDDARPRITQTGYVMGTPAYMSPEQTSGIPDRIGPPSDVWSMGVVWYEALTGTMPFNGPTPTAVMMEVTSAKLARLSSLLPALPARLTQAIDGALVRDVAQRYATMGAFLEALHEAMNREREAPPALAAPPPLSSPVITVDETTEPSLVVLRALRHKAPSRALLASLVAAFAGVAVAVALLTPEPRNAPEPRPAPVASRAVAPSAAAASPHLQAPEAASTLAARPIAVAPERGRSERPHADAGVGHRPAARAARPPVSRSLASPAGPVLPRPNAPITDYDGLH